jgi:hypothetical protein
LLLCREWLAFVYASKNLKYIIKIFIAILALAVKSSPNIFLPFAKGYAAAEKRD